jgi:hypothetical protein
MKLTAKTRAAVRTKMIKRRMSGAGLDYTMGTYFTSNLTAAMALRDGLDTPAKAWRISLRVSMSY